MSCFFIGDDLRLYAFKINYQTIVELDESVHRSRLQVIEGGHWNIGFSSYKASFQLTAIQEQKTLVICRISVSSMSLKFKIPCMSSKSTKSVLAFIKNLESYLLKGAA